MQSGSNGDGSLARHPVIHAVRLIDRLSDWVIVPPHSVSVLVRQTIRSGQGDNDITAKLCNFSWFSLLIIGHDV